MEKQELIEKQVGFLVRGGGLDTAWWISEAKSRGEIVKEFPEHIEFYVMVKK